MTTSNVHLNVSNNGIIATYFGSIATEVRNIPMHGQYKM